jgi:hypothetical protein
MQGGRVEAIWEKSNQIFGAPGGIRTPNPQIRSLMLCPVELRARMARGNDFADWALTKVDDI